MDKKENLKEEKKEEQRGNLETQTEAKSQNIEIDENHEEIKKANKMGTMPVTRLLINMAWPAMLSMMIQALYNVVDSIFVSQTGEAALTALTLANPAQLVFIAVGVGTGVGINSLISRRLGAKRYGEASLAASMGIKLAVMSWVVFAILGFFLSGPFIGLFTDDPTIKSQGTIYLTIVLVFCLFGMLHMVIEKMIQSTGNMIMPMIASLIGAGINIILDPIMIFGLGPAPAMGVAGAAIATVTGQCCGMVTSLIILYKKCPILKINIRSKFDFKTFKDIYAVGLPSILMQMVMSVAQFVLNFIFAGFSSTVVAVAGAYGRLQSFIFLPCFGLNQGAMPIFGFNYGARNKERLMKTLKSAFFFSFTIMMIGLLLFQFVPDVLLSFFSASPKMLAIGVPAFRIISICFIPASIGVVSAGLFGATGHGLISFISTLIRQFAFVVPLAILLAHFGGIHAVWWCFPLSEIFGLTYVILMIRWVYVKDIKKLENPIDFS